MLIACWIGNKATKELYSTSTMPGKILSKFNEENAWFLPQFFVVKRFNSTCSICKFDRYNHSTIQNVPFLSY